MRVIKYIGFASIVEGLKSDAQFDENEAVKVRRILEDVRLRGDVAVREYTLQFDRIRCEGFRVDPRLLENVPGIDGETMSALRLAASRLRVFAERQLAQLRDFEVETAPGVFAGQRVVPLRRVGVYVPGGNFPLVSSLLMGAVPASVAGVAEIVICTPPDPDGLPPAPILAAAAVVGVDEVYAVGGVQAIAAMAYGTQTIKPVDKIVGPGNRYVTAAKKEVYGRVGIDFIAGPSEVMVVADQCADPRWIAADLLAQAEHDVSAVPILVTDSEELIEKVRREVDRQLVALGTRDIAAASIANNGVIFQVENLDQAVEVADRVAPEHLELHLVDAEAIAGRFSNYGTLFIGANSAEVFGDYSSGLNHTLPTSGAARYTGGLSVFDFVKVLTTLRTTDSGIENIAPSAVSLARLEGLEAHEKAAAVRLGD